MCIGNTTSPAATNTNYIGWRDDQWERPEVIDSDTASSGQKRDNLKAGGKQASGSGKRNPNNQSNRTSGGTY